MKNYQGVAGMNFTDRQTPYTYIKASEVKLTFEKPEIWTLDGECGGEATQVDLKVLHRAVNIFSPENSMFSHRESKEEATV